ncbi:zinc finger protein 318 [Pleuronectes platessa]|uniref:zinc finger protein 318 n=1 Tax=Pleuronectes platessa TaxID=8262 RepID=UPI00232A7246|nr:zinc finger protein 318 [Pleuronectes platessa]
MNPRQWGDALRGLQEHLDPSDDDVSNSMRNTSRSYNGCDTYCEYSRYPADEAHNRSGVNAAEEMNDMELARKCEELREIHQKIILKKASIALKALEPGLSSDADTSNRESLRDRVNFILQQRQSLSIWPKVLSPKRRMNSSKDDLILEDHPLKLRVKALMKQRFSDPHVMPPNTEVPEVTPPPPSQRVTSPAKEETRDMGFQRFLSVLNKGVDIDLLSRIVNEDGENLALGEEIFNIQPSAVEDKSEMGESQGSHSRDSLPGYSGTDDGARRTSLPSREKSLNNSPPLRGDEEKKKYDKGDGSLCSGRGSQSPPAVKKKKKEEEPPKVDEQHEQLQNILKTLGLSLEVEEMSKLADRTQERLYGKKPEGRVDADSHVEQESPQRASDRHCRSSSSSSSRSTEVSYIPSLSRKYPSNTWCTERKLESECSNSGDGNQDSEEAQRPRDIDTDEDRGEDSSYVYQYYQEQVYCNAHPASLSEFSDYTLPHGSRYTDYNGATTNSYSTYTEGVVPPPLDVRGYPYPPVRDHYFPESVVAPNIVNPLHKWQRRRSAFKDINLLVNPDLSTSEGQAGSAGKRCLQVINTVSTEMRQTWIQPRSSKYSEAQRKSKNRARARRRRHKRNLNESNLKTAKPKEGKRLPREEEGKRLPREEEEERLPREEEEKRLPREEEEKRLPREEEEKRLPREEEGKRLPREEEEKRLPPEEEEKRLTSEEEIKVNLRKKLEAFNQKVRRQVTQPAISRTPHNESVDYQDLI